MFGGYIASPLIGLIGTPQHAGVDRPGGTNASRSSALRESRSGACSIPANIDYRADHDLEETSGPASP
jgi:hypothetical protein